jgi:hypothetical protein
MTSRRPLGKRGSSHHAAVGVGDSDLSFGKSLRALGVLGTFPTPLSHLGGGGRQERMGKEGDIDTNRGADCT